jgi:hypothetical protein
MLFSFFTNFYNYFIYINLIDFFLFLGIQITFWFIITNVVFRKKFLFFLFFLFFLSCWGFTYSWDGWVCLMLLTELLIILLFLLVWLSFKFVSDSNNALSTVKYIYWFLTTFLYLTVLPLNYSNFIYSYQLSYWFNFNILSSDFHLMFKFFFLDYPITVFIITLILSLISLFFICFYLLLKNTQNTKKTKQKLIYILRKQQMLKQATFKNQIRSFQKN